MTMTRNQKVGTAIASAIDASAEWLLCRLFPSLSVTDKVDECFGYASDDSQSMRRYALVKQFANVHNLFGCELVRRLVLSVQINKPGFPSVLSVSGNADPFKVIGSVVSLDPVDVVDAKAWLVAINECKGNKSMNEESSTFAVNTKPDFFVSSMVRLRRYFSSLSLARNGLRLSVADSGIGVRSSWNTNPTIATNLKSNSALSDSFPSLHPSVLSVLCVCIIGGSL